jgi:hypothetical protein
MVVWCNVFAQTTFNQPVRSTIKHVLVFIENNSVLINGQGNSEINIEIDKPIQTPQMAEGLRRVYQKGLNDNTQLGLSVQQEDSVMVIREVCNCHDGVYRISIPQNLDLTMVEYVNENWDGNRNYNNWGNNWNNRCEECSRNTWTVKNLNGMTNLTAVYRNIYLDNPSGIIKAESRYGKIRGRLRNPKNSSFTSTYSQIELDISESVNADLAIKKCEYGEIFSDFDNLIMNNDTKFANLKLNKGGAKIEAKTTYGNVFIRKSL